MKTVCPQGRVGSNPTLSACQAKTSKNKKLEKVLDKTKTVRYNNKAFERQISRNGSESIVGQFGEVPKLAEGAPLERE